MAREENSGAKIKLNSVQNAVVISP